LVPKSCIELTSNKPLATIYLQDVGLEVFNPGQFIATVLVKLENLTILSQEWLIVPLSRLHLFVDLNEVPDYILPTILMIIQRFGHVPVLSCGYADDGELYPEIMSQLREPLLVSKVIDSLQRISGELQGGASTIDLYPVSDIVQLALRFVRNMFEWYDNQPMGYYRCFEKSMSDTERTKLQGVVQAIEQYRRQSQQRQVRRSPRIFNQRAG
jgi:hypothetical protein